MYVIHMSILLLTLKKYRMTELRQKTQYHIELTMPGITHHYLEPLT